MKTVVVSSAPLIQKADGWYAYSPYVQELELWAKYATTVTMVCPVWSDTKGTLVTRLSFSPEHVITLHEFNIKTLQGVLRAFFFLLPNLWKLYRAMQRAEHIHLRCPGNLSLLGCVVQSLFPKTYKTCKYAGNWDPKAAQPLAYRWQKKLLSHTRFTQNMRVLVYGEWPQATKNIVPFFTASYYASEIHSVPDRWDTRPWHVVFVGTLGTNKRPMYVVELVAQLRQQGVPITLALYGHGAAQARIAQFIQEHNLSQWIVLQGNQPREVIQQALCKAHFVCLPSQSEGWPKAVAEGMFWGAIPWATPVSCVPQMLDEGRRGLLLTLDMDRDLDHIKQLCTNPNALRQQAQQAMEWSRQYTLDAFEMAIRKLMQP